MSDIRTELSDSGEISLKEASDGTIATINTNNGSGYRPDGSAPHSMSEFYAYNHTNDNTTSWSSVPGDFSMSVSGLSSTAHWPDFRQSPIFGLYVQ